MLKRYIIDEVTETRASRRQAFSLFSQVSGWSDWCSVVRYARLFGGEWRRGAGLLLVADLPGLPLAPIVVRVRDYRENQSISWGLTLPMASITHRFTFIDDGDGGCHVHQEEWSENLMTLATLPTARLIHRFDQRFAAEFAAMF